MRKALHRSQFLFILPQIAAAAAADAVAAVSCPLTFPSHSPPPSSPLVIERERKTNCRVYKKKWCVCVFVPLSVFGHVKQSRPLFLQRLLSFRYSSWLLLEVGWPHHHLFTSSSSSPLFLSDITSSQQPPPPWRPAGLPHHRRKAPPSPQHQRTDQNFLSHQDLAGNAVHLARRASSTSRTTRRRNRAQRIRLERGLH